MGKSILERTGEDPPLLGKGHGTEALGPSDRSDTGSDVAGEQTALAPERATPEPATSGNAPATASPTGPTTVRLTALSAKKRPRLQKLHTREP